MSVALQLAESGFLLGDALGIAQDCYGINQCPGDTERGCQKPRWLIGTRLVFTHVSDWVITDELIGEGVNAGDRIFKQYTAHNSQLNGTWEGRPFRNATEQYSTEEYAAVLASLPNCESLQSLRTARWRWHNVSRLVSRNEQFVANGPVFESSGNDNVHTWVNPCGTHLHTTLNWGVLSNYQMMFSHTAESKQISIPEMCTYWSTQIFPWDTQVSPGPMRYCVDFPDYFETAIDIASETVVLTNPGAWTRKVQHSGQTASMRLELDWITV